MEVKVRTNNGLFMKSTSKSGRVIWRVDDVAAGTASCTDEVGRRRFCIATGCGGDGVVALVVQFVDCAINLSRVVR
jgi:hypothetical protein